MKKLLLAAVAATMGLFASAQTSDKIWNIGIEGGGEQYNGSFGNAFYQPSHGMYGFGGLSIYVGPHGWWHTGYSRGYRI